MTALPKGDRIQLHGLLRAAAEPWLEAPPVEPIIIGWYQYRSRHPNDPQIGLFRLQYGARAWSTGAYSFGNSNGPVAPKYQAQFEQQASILREAKWDRLCASLLKTEPSKNKYDQPEIEMFLLIDNFACHFGVRSKSPTQEEYFLVTEAGLEPNPAAPKVWFDAWPEQSNPPLFLPTHMAGALNRQDAAVLARHVKWWYQTPLMPADEASERLGALLKVLFERLARLGNAVAIATSPHRFNDACGDDNWLAAFVDGSLWENGVYFTSSAKTLASTPRALHEAMGLLQEVMTSRIRQKLAEYLGNESASPDTLILSSDRRGYLIALSRSHENGGPVYRVDQESGLPSLLGVAPRLDWRFAECCRAARDAVDEASRGDIVQFVPLSEWIEKLGGDDEVAYDYPELNHI